MRKRLTVAGIGVVFLVVLAVITSTYSNEVSAIKNVVFGGNDPDKPAFFKDVKN